MASFRPTNTHLTPSPGSSPRGTPRNRSPQPPKPTLLAFHGSGSNGMVHTVQLARVSKLLRPHFDIISLDAPFPSDAGPGILPFFDGCGPYYRWIPATAHVINKDMILNGLTPTGTPLPSAMPLEVETLVRTTVEKVRAKGGRVVGTIGFSQGTRVAAGLLRGSEIRRTIEQSLSSTPSTAHAETKALLQSTAWLDFHFGISVCGSYPPVLLPPSATELLRAHLQTTAEPEALEAEVVEMQNQKIEAPTLHIAGLHDHFLWAGRLFVATCFVEGADKSRVHEFDMEHHYPTQPADSETMAEWTLGAWKRVTDREEGVGYEGGS
ncbi:hypothetical protein K491DRAFT_721743 [Lophiostoma macrostomum CBS 122681]|uniref:Serine hydrolase domain-containing protein n=1 Tax=Lophiostoma macrostomum CBS 122681 TaxID=1314788 RepID=A0A6A6SQS5_9PLEO|nr:hypothetical protein K491DRAFT_721743 [Lophiostoma macrostomum CBS 122681]